MKKITKSFGTVFTILTLLLGTALVGCSDEGAGKDEETPTTGGTDTSFTPTDNTGTGQPDSTDSGSEQETGADGTGGDSDTGENTDETTDESTDGTTDESTDGTGGAPDTDEDEGQDTGPVDTDVSDFVSADGEAGEDANSGADGDDDGEASLSADDSDKDSGGERTVEEGDIYRVANAGNIIFNLNSYRGFQVIDIADLANPTIIGRFPVAGYPVEMYVVDDRAYMLINNWRGYYGNRDDVLVESYDGGLLLALDVSDVNNPKEISRALVPGYIQTSRLIGNEVQRAIYVAASNWRGDTETVVKSFGVLGDGTVEDRTTLSLGGYVQDIQASPEALMVSRVDWTEDERFSTVSVIDVSDPDGTMIEGAEVEVEGYISNKTNMNIYKDVMRLVSGSTWSGTNENHLQTFNISDIHNPVAVDHDVFGEGEDLYATLFLENKAFFVTYFRTDPFHAFEIDDAGNATERAEYIISGWNSYFRPVFDDTRIVGIGTNDEEGRNMAVSLYDITDLSNPDPFIARQEVAATDYSWSEASWDDRAFSVLENAVSVTTADGVEETGLVLLPFSGYDRSDDNYKYVAAVQLFTFSSSTLTRRGLMTHDTPVRRSFNPKDSTTANLSEDELSLFNTQDPDTPNELSRLELAPNYADFLVFGEYGVRLKSYSSYYYYYYGDERDAQTANAAIEVVSLDEDPDAAEPLASIEVSSDGTIFKVGDHIAVTLRSYYDSDVSDYVSFVQVIDLSIPTTPAKVAEFEMAGISRYYYYDYYYMGMDDCWYGYAPSPNPEVLGNAVVFPQYESHYETTGNAEYCYYYLDDSNYSDCYDDDWNMITGCTYRTGQLYCTTPEGETTESCSGDIVDCTVMENGGRDCVEVDIDRALLTESCYDRELYRYWSTLKLTVLDLSDPANPVVQKEVALPDTEDYVELLSDGTTLYANYKVPHDVTDDARSYVKYYYRAIEFANPAAPAMSEPVNIPGIMLDITGDTLYTGDLVYGEEVIETAVNRLRIKDGKAYLQARRVFEDRAVNALVQDDTGHILVVDHEILSPYSYDPDAVDRLLILDADADMTVKSEYDVDRWSNLRSAEKGRALFSVSGGVLVVNIADTTKPYAQAYFPLMGWPDEMIVQGDDLIVPAGKYGIYSFDLDTYNLMPKE